MAVAPTFKPHNYVRDLVAYTGTHDNDTVVGWWTSGGTSDSTRTPEDVVKEHAHARAYLGFKDEPIHWVLIRSIMSSIANTAIASMQDILGLGKDAHEPSRHIQFPGASRPGGPYGTEDSSCTPFQMCAHFRSTAVIVTVSGAPSTLSCTFAVAGVSKSFRHGPCNVVELALFSRALSWKSSGKSSMPLCRTARASPYDPSSMYSVARFSYTSRK